MKRTFLSLLLVLLILLTVLTACGEDLPADVGSQTEDTSAPVSDTVESADPGEAPADGLVLVQNGEAKYTIIRPEKPPTKKKTPC
jgi:predicted small lipoprotein YifL